MKTYCCKTCGVTFEIPDTQKRPTYCPPHREAAKRAYWKRQGDLRKATRKVVTGETTTRQWAKRVNELSICSRIGAAALLGVSEEQIRRDEMSIVRKIRLACAGLAKEAGYKFEGIHTARFTDGKNIQPL